MEKDSGESGFMRGNKWLGWRERRFIGCWMRT